MRMRFFSEPLRQVPMTFQLIRKQGRFDRDSSLRTSMAGRASFCVSLTFSSKTLMKASDATASRQQERPFMSAQEMSLMVLLYLIFGTLIFSRGLPKLRLKFTKATVLITSGFSSSSSIAFWKIFIPFITFLGEDQRFLQPTAMMASSSFTRFLLQERQLRPSSLTWRLQWLPHSLSLRGSSAMSTLRYPSEETMARQSPQFLLGMNLMSSMALFSWMLWMETQELFSPSPFSTFFSSYMRICVSREQVAMIVPNQGRAHFTFQAAAPWMVSTSSFTHFSPRLMKVRMVLSLQTAASRRPVQSKLISWTMMLGGRSPMISILLSSLINQMWIMRIIIFFNNGKMR